MKKLILLMLLLLSTPSVARVAEAIFAGGNFWRLEALFNQMDGVLTTVSGFDGGTSKDPSFEEVQMGKTDYIQAIRVVYNPDCLSYKQIVDYFWQNIDPTDQEGQFCDKGRQFRSAIFYLNEQQKKIALASLHQIEKKFKKIYTQILPSTQFYAAEGDQQDYYQNHPLRYRYYIFRCGQNDRIAEIWK